MKVFAILFAIAALGVPVAAQAQIPLVSSQVQRQSILDLEYLLNYPGLPPAQAEAASAETQAIQTQINGPDLPALNVPVYGGCDADQSLLAYLQDLVQNANLDPQSIYAYKRNIYDISVNLRQRGC
jgi:hypothetical protein